jgi:hypothetical protein
MKTGVTTMINRKNTNVATDAQAHHVRGLRRMNA